MKKIKKLLMWYYMFSKRLFKRYSFIVILLTIPLMIPVAKTVMSEDSGMVTVALYGQDETAKEIIKTLTGEDSVMRYRVFEDEQEAVEAVKKTEADAAWIFPNDIKNKIGEFVAKQSTKPFVEVVQREETISLKLSREKLYGAVYPYVAYEVLKNYTYTQFATPQQIPESVLEQMFASTDEYEDIINIKRLDSDEEVVLSKNFLTIPLRGLLSLVVMLCGMAAAMYFLRDSADGKFDWLAPKKRMAPAFGSCLAATVAASAAVFAALFFSGIFTDAFFEILAMLLYAVSAAGFCLVLCVVFRSAGRLGASIPFFMIIMIVLCPIFFNLNILKPVQLALPPYYYLQSLYNHSYILYMLCYCIGVYVTAYILNMILSTGKRRASD